jgi:hypothetical protein
MTKSLDDQIELSTKADIRLKLDEARLKNEFYTLNDSIIDSNNQLL